ncbi:MAG: hypothetical protein JXB29_12315 [Sedimentisphaerales bacterium]|nr:hypothetical protein [Sedimentisphaerales bacterium]
MKEEKITIKDATVKTVTVGTIKKHPGPKLEDLSRCRASAMLYEAFHSIPLEEQKEHPNLFAWFKAFHYMSAAFYHSTGIMELVYEELYKSDYLGVSWFVTNVFAIRDYLEKIDELCKKDSPLNENEEQTRNRVSKNIGIRFGRTVGFCALDVANRVTRMTSRCIDEAQAKSKTLQNEKELNSLIAFRNDGTAPDPRLFRWAETAILLMREQLPPIDDWPAWQMLADRDNVAIRMAGEMAEIEGEYWERVQENKSDTKKPQLTTKGYMLGALYDNISASDSKIARMAGVHKSTLSRFKPFQNIREWLKESGKKERGLTGGSKDGETGDMEAWDNE